MSTLFLIRGLPGSGKSTLADALQRQHIEADMFFIVKGVYAFDATRLKDAHEWCQMRTRQMLQDGDVVVSNTFTRRWELQHYYDLNIGKPFRIVEITVNTMLTDEGLAARTTHGITADKIKAMRERWEA